MSSVRYARGTVVAALLGSLAAAITSSIRSALAASNPNPVLVAPNPNYNAAEANEALVRNFINSAWNRQTVAAPAAPGQSTYMNVLSASASKGCIADTFVKTENYQSFVDGYRKAFPNLRVTIQSMQSTANGVTVRWSANGTYAGGFAANGKQLTGIARPMSITGNAFFRISGGKIESMGMSYDSSALEHQISQPVVQIPAGAGISH